MKRPWHTAVVTGAASGIGLEFSRALAADGCRLILIDRSSLANVKSELSAFTSVQTIEADLTASGAIDTILQSIRQSGDKPDLLINNAGIFDFRATVDLPESRVATYIDLHIKAVTELSLAIGRMMADNGGGYILNMSSMSCWMPMPGITMYSATKAYIRVFSRALNLELRNHGVSVTVACPGGIATDLFGLPKRLQRIGVAMGALITPRKFVRKALRATSRRRSQYINGVLNRMAIVAVGAMPDILRRKAVGRLLSHLNPS